MRFQDKVTLVTGGSSGIGLATARLLAREGAAVMICGRDGERLHRRALLEGLAGTVEAVRCDVSRSPTSTISSPRIDAAHSVA